MMIREPHFLRFVALLLLTFFSTVMLLCSSSMSITISSSSSSPLQAIIQNPLFCLTLSRLPKQVRQVLEKGGTTSDRIILSKSVDANNFLSSLPISPKHKAAARFGMSKECIQTVPCVLSARECNSLSQWATDKMNNEKTITRIDTVDGCPEYQVPIDRKTLVNIIGNAQVEAIWKLPLKYLMEAAHFEATTTDSSTTNDNGIILTDDQLLQRVDVGCFIRKYTSSSRPFLGFHVDDCDATVNICLSHPQNHQGGQLIALSNGTVLTVDPRNIGDGTIHPWYCCHGVSAVTAGERWSLIAFFSNAPYPPLHKGFYNMAYINNNNKKHKVKKNMAL